ncbi:MAG TPA: UTP--glucose-1-phosphate uridylyltransferase GalU [Sedimentibacter sp.]|jgi:UTP--glucose-1-phosphate uridylyltransferase|nr:UTP--glucose-1-phosphate uridylyltransferase GalU [Sedimentibacter sp.]HOK48937.1 UTP--glucose-1-phosphate uridylyltransferase GalU [Sedimentibacter sp.]HRC80619.1 UTP--glucose-1-phosphate uridylyltransferase GalU [Sedimentibacter sp.]
MKVRKAVIPAAGLGTRFLPATKAIPKEMLPIVDKPTIQYIVEEVVASGIEDVLIITGRNKSSIEEHFDRAVELECNLESTNKEELLEEIRNISKLINVHTVRQKDPLGLGHAIYCARAFVGNEPFAVLLGDDVVDSKKPCLAQMLEIFEEYGSTILGVQPVEWEKVNKYGIISGNKINDRIYSVYDLVEKPDKNKAPTNIAILGRYILTPEIFKMLENTKAGVNGEIQLTDGLKNLCNFEKIYAYVFEGRRYDVGSKLGFLEANIDFALKNEQLREGLIKYIKSIDLE